MNVEATFKGNPGNTVHCFEVGATYDIFVTVMAWVSLSPCAGSYHSSGARITEIRQYQTLKEFLDEWELI